MFPVRARKMFLKNSETFFCFLDAKFSSATNLSMHANEETLGKESFCNIVSLFVCTGNI